MSRLLDVKKQEDEKRNYLSEFHNKIDFAERVMNDVYSQREKKLRKSQTMISALIDEGDFEAAMSKLSEVDAFMAKSPDDEIKERLTEYNFINRTDKKE